MTLNLPIDVDDAYANFNDALANESSSLLTGKLPLNTGFHVARYLLSRGESFHDQGNEEE
jgi:hypothetical protein